jgi:hypothetical protein
MNTLNAVLLSIVVCAGIQVAWHLFTLRSHRGEHARADALYSPYSLVARIEQERRELCDSGKHHIRAGESPAMARQDLPLLSGYSELPTIRGTLR